MKLKFNTLVTSLLLLFSCVTWAQRLSAQHSPLTSSAQEGVTWWGYFDGNFDNTVSQGLGTGIPYPLTYNCAIKLGVGNEALRGKPISAVKFGFFRMDNIENVKVWLSSSLPIIPEAADISCQPVSLSSFKDAGSGHFLAEVPLSQPYVFGSTDVYVGYSFTVTSDEGDVNTYPVMVSDSETAADAFFFNWDTSWDNLSGKDFGNLALMLSVGDEVSFVPGDVNYDLKVNVGDLSATIGYIMKGSAEPFNRQTADIDGNGSVDVVDLSSIIDIILGKYKAPSAE